MVMTHIQSKNEGQRSVYSNDRVETDGQTDTTENILPFPLTWSVTNNGGNLLIEN